MAETAGTILCKEFGIPMKKSTLFDASMEKYISQKVDEAGDRIMQNVHDKLFYHPTESEVALHKFIMAAPIKKTSLKSFRDFRKQC